MVDLMAGYRPLLGAALRTQAPRVLVWLLVVPGLAASSAAAYDWVLPDEQAQHDMDLTIRSNPAFKMIFGPLGDLSTRDGFTSWHALTLGCLFTAVMASLLVIRASRGDEDSGQAELIAAGMVGGGTRLLVAESLAVLASLAVGVGTFGATVAAGGSPGPSALLAAGYVASGLVFAAVAAVAAQLGGSASSARSLGLGVLGVTYMARGWFDASSLPGWVSWTTPIAWIQHIEPAVEDDWRPLLIPLAVAGAISAVAHVLQRRRDFGLGMVTPPPGPGRGGLVATLPGLLWRVNRGPLLAWLIALTLLGAEFGNVATSIGSVISTNPELAQVIAAGATTESQVTAGFVLVIVILLGVLAALPGIQAVARLAVEEDEHRLEPLIAGAVRRPTVLALAAAAALVASAAGMILGGLGLTLVAGVQGVTLTARDMIWQSVVCIPAVWSLVALTVAGVGVARRLAMVGWVGAAAAFGVTILGPLFKLDDRILAVSPFWHVPNVTTAHHHWGPTGIVALAVVALLLVGVVGFRRRDVH